MSDHFLFDMPISSHFFDKPHINKHDSSQSQQSHLVKCLRLLFATLPEARTVNEDSIPIRCPYPQHQMQQMLTICSLSGFGFRCAASIQKKEQPPEVLAARAVVEREFGVVYLFLAFHRERSADCIWFTSARALKSLRSHLLRERWYRAV